jgi:hypothetical protein
VSHDRDRRRYNVLLTEAEWVALYRAALRDAEHTKRRCHGTTFVDDDSGQYYAGLRMQALETFHAANVLRLELLENHRIRLTESTIEGTTNAISA